MKTSHIMCTLIILTDACFTKQRIKTKNIFARVFLQCFSSNNVLTEHKKVCFSINCAHVIFGKVTIEFKNYFNQVPVPFKFYAHFECNLNKLKVLVQKTIKINFIVLLLTNLFALIIDSVKMLLINLLKQFLESMNNVKK